ncbi:MAG: VTT domain-containing protein [Acidobacteria bacterium]|nr:VTT domain-containing protein [Acidobacteriota bacterium]
MFEWFKDWFIGLTRQVVILPMYWAAPMMLVIGALDSSLLSLPEVNDYITVARVANNPSEVYYFPLFPAIGSLIGCVLLYRIARRGEQFVTRRFHPKHLDRVKELYKKWGLFALVIPAILPPPMPFKIFVVTAGVLNYPLGRFAVIVMIARTIRYYFWGILAYFFRDEVRKMIDWLEHHVLEILAVMLGIMVLSLAVRWLFNRFKSKPEISKAEISFSD